MLEVIAMLRAKSRSSSFAVTARIDSLLVRTRCPRRSDRLPMNIAATPRTINVIRVGNPLSRFASREVMDLIKSGDVIGSGDYDTFAQGCLAVEMAVRAVRKENVPHELILKPTVIDKTNYAPFDQPLEKRDCPTLTNVDRQ